MTNRRDQLVHDRITFNHAVLCGKPTIRGLRISVETVLELRAEGASEQEILEDFPELEPDDICAAVAYAHRLVPVGEGQGEGFVTVYNPQPAVVSSLARLQERTNVRRESPTVSGLQSPASSTASSLITGETGDSRPRTVDPNGASASGLPATASSQISENRAEATSTLLPSALCPLPATPRILYVVHRFPYPPDKGDRLRTYNIIRFLAERAEIDVACLADEPVQDEHREALARICRRLEVIRIDSPLRWVRAAGSLAVGRSISEGAFAAPRLRRTIRLWARDTQYTAALGSASSVAPYLKDLAFSGVPAVIDLMDVDSQKWRDYAASKRGPKAWLYRLEGRRLGKLERSLLTWTRAVTFVSAAEANLFRRTCEEAGDLRLEAGSGRPEETGGRRPEAGDRASPLPLGEDQGEGAGDGRPKARDGRHKTPFPFAGEGQGERWNSCP